MNIAYSNEQWARTQMAFAQWWDGTLERPLVPIILKGRDPERPVPRRRGERLFANDESISPEDIVDCADYELARCEFLGDACPQWGPNFAPGVVAAFLGAEVHVNEASSWLTPAHTVEIADLHLSFDPANPYLQRMARLMQAGVDRWQGMVQIIMPDLGGTFDILSTFRPGELLLMDLYDEPDEVARVVREIHEAWFACFDYLRAIIEPTNPGHGCWGCLLSDKPYYMLQCDFSYMIGPDTFRSFVLPELAQSCRRLGRSFYHLDGTGQLPHVDTLLAIPELSGIQWVPGPGYPPSFEWTDLHARILAAGKRVQLCGHVPHLDTLVDVLGTGQGIFMWPYTMPIEQRKLAETYLHRYGVPV